MLPLGGLATLGASELARRTFSSLSTARRWIRSGQAPRLIVEYLQLMLDGPLDRVDAAWRGWRVRRGQLHSPEGHSFGPLEVAGIPYRHMRLAELESALERAQRQVRDPAEQHPVPPGPQARRRYSDFLNDRHVLLPPFAEAPATSARRQSFSLSWHFAYSAFFQLEVPAAALAPQPVTADRVHVHVRCELSLSLRQDPFPPQSIHRMRLLAEAAYADAGVP